ncbi:MAG TPA: hypothetical protein VKL21_07305 [Candidatus Methanoperedens sp.]|nr:hypothetical protein [Candidatus Methanoperedens sp.]
MVKNEKKKVFCSSIEFKKTYFPKSFEKQAVKELEDAHNLGIRWAKESLDKIKCQIQR